ncbi:MAG: hypothetical protein M3536_00205 [Actinomycetota bacterium]|nr:hypothetical protein [Actinomycetota bacterium]
MSTNPYDAVAALMAPARIVAPGSFDDGREYPPSEHNIEMAKVWAVMALAHEQRTANLIALAQMEHRNSIGIGFHEDYDSATIHERLGME